LNTNHTILVNEGFEQMALKCVMLALLMVNGAVASSNMRGVDVHQLHTEAVASATSHVSKAINWTTVGMGALVGALIGGAVMGGVMMMGKKKEEEEGDADEKATPLLAEVAQEEEKAQNPTDYAALLQSMAKKMTEEVGPKFEKGGAVRNVLEKRMDTFTDKAKNFLLSELNGTASAVMSEMEKEESTLMLEWNHAVEANFPPASILLAGVLSPTVINFMSFHHMLQMVTVGLPLFCLCIWAVWEDWGQPCVIQPSSHGCTHRQCWHSVFFSAMQHSCHSFRQAGRSWQPRRQRLRRT